MSSKLVINYPIVTNLRVTLFLNNKKCIKKVNEMLRNMGGVRKFSNFFIYENRYIFTIFFNNEKIGVTKIRGEHDLENVILHFCSIFSLLPSEVEEKIRIDNISASGTFAKQLNLATIQQLANKSYKKGNEDITIQFDRDIRPEAICRTFSIGNLTLFASGKYFVVGAKSLANVKDLVEKVDKVINGENVHASGCL